MNNLPSNPTRFDKFRNTAFKVALSTGFTRKILANLAPQSALDYASTLEDNQEFVDVVLSMNDRTLEKNIRRISEPIKKLVYDTEIDNKNSDIIKSILGRMPENRKEYFSKLYIQSNSIISYEKMDSIFEASKNINYSNLSDEELNNYIIHYANLLPNRSNQVYYNILEQLPYERRINFFDEIIYNSHFNSYYQNDKRINDYLALIKPEDRLEKFKTILAEVNKKQQLGDFTDITSCFQMLGENERKEIFGALIEYVSKAEQSYQKENCAFNIISSATNIEEQKKYIDVCLDLYKNGKESKAIIAFTNKIEPELRKEKASELIKLYTTTLNLEMQQTYVSSVSDNIIPFLTLFDNTEQNEIIESLLAHTSLSNLDYKNLFSKLPSEQQFKHFYGFQEKMEQNRKDYDYSNIFLDLYSALKKETKQSLLKELCETSDNKSLENLQKIFNAHYYSPIAIAEVSQGQCILDDKTIIELMKRDSTIVEKVLLFDKDISEYIKNIDFESYTEDPYTANSKFLEGLPKNVVKKYFNIFYEIQKDKNYMRNHENFSTLYKLVDNETKKDVLAKHIINGEEKDLQLVNNILNEHNAKELVHISDGEITIDEKTIMELIQINPNNVNKVLLFHKEACEHLKNIDIANMNSNEIVSSLPKEFIGKYLNEFAKSHKNEPLKFFDKAFSNLYTSLDDNIKVDLFKYFASNSEKRNLASLTMILNNYDIKDLVRLFGNQVTLDEETIKALIQQDSNIAMKTMLFDKDIDREKLLI